MTSSSVGGCTASPLTGDRVDDAAQHLALERRQRAGELGRGQRHQHRRLDVTFGDELVTGQTGLALRAG